MTGWSDTVLATTLAATCGKKLKVQRYEVEQFLMCLLCIFITSNYFEELFS